MKVRAVLDTNTVISALLFQGGRMTWLRDAWRTGVVTPLVSKATAEELLRVLAYPKFRLTEAERDELLGDFLPYAEVVTPVAGDPLRIKCRDPDDQKFLDLAVPAEADALITGDADLLSLSGQSGMLTISPAELHGRLTLPEGDRGL